MTLLELLIVIMILLMVTAAAIPIMAPALENRRMREAARLASSFISGARAKAIQSGREVGVVLQRFEGRPYAMSMSYVEVPPPYGGDTAGATCTVAPTAADASSQANATATGLTPLFWLGVEMPAGTFNYNLVRIGDGIQFNYQGPIYRILGPDADGDQTIDGGAPMEVTELSTTAIAGKVWPWQVSTPNVKYQVIRQPLRTSDQPLQLPDGMVIDLLCSGQTLSAAELFVSTAPGVVPTRPPHWPNSWPTNWQASPPTPYDPIITFTPNGSVGHVVTTQAQRAKGPIFLMLGRRELMPDVAPITNPMYMNMVEDKNVFDSDTNPKNLYLQNFWITIGNQTGLVTTSEVTRNLGPVADAPNYLQNARSIAITSQSIGGR